MLDDLRSKGVSVLLAQTQLIDAPLAKRPVVFPLIASHNGFKFDLRRWAPFFITLQICESLCDLGKPSTCRGEFCFAQHPFPPIAATLALVTLPTGRHEVCYFTDEPGWATFGNQGSEVVPFGCFVTAIRATHVSCFYSKNRQSFVDLIGCWWNGRDDRIDEGIRDARFSRHHCLYRGHPEGRRKQSAASIVHWRSHVNGPSLARRASRGFRTSRATRLKTAIGSAPHADANQQNSTMSSRRSPDSTLAIQLCGTASCIAKSRCESPAIVRIFRSSARRARYSLVWVDFSIAPIIGTC